MVPLPDDDWHGSMEDGPNPEEIVERHGIDGSIERAITELPKTFRTAVVLCDVQGLSYEEITEATNRETLPPEAQQYLERIETITGLPIDIISVGPDRAQTVRSSPAAGAVS